MRGEPLAVPADRASGCPPQCFMEREHPRAEEARVSGPPSPHHLPPAASWGCSHSPSIPLQGDNGEGDPGCAGSPGLPGPPGLPGQRGEEVRAEPSPGLESPQARPSVPEGSFIPSESLPGPSGGSLTGSPMGAFEALGHRPPFTALSSPALLVPGLPCSSGPLATLPPHCLAGALLQGLLLHPFNALLKCHLLSELFPDHSL